MYKNTRWLQVEIQMVNRMVNCLSEEKPSKAIGIIISKFNGPGAQWL